MRSDFFAFGLALCAGSAAKFTVIARPDSRIVMASTPWGRQDRFFAVTYRAGQRSHSDDRLAGHESFHWPSTVSPLVDTRLLDAFRVSMTEREYAREVEAEWVDEAGAYFTSSELASAVADYRLIDPMQGNGQMVVAGIDWGVAQDANALVLIGALADGELNFERHRSHVVYFIPYLEERFGMPYSQFVDRVVQIAERPSVPNVLVLGPITRLGYFMRYVASERNGVGAMPTEVLARKMWEQRLHVGRVEGIHTDARRKQTAFGAIKLLLQQGRLVLPGHPELLRQLSSLEYETLDTGNLRIAVPEQRGHDDLAMALAQAASCLRIQQANRRHDPPHGSGEILTTGSGTRIFERPRCSDNVRAFTSPRGASNEDDW